MSEAQILIATNVIADAELAANALRGEFKSVLVSSRPDSALTDFEVCKPEVLVMAFRDLADAEHHYRSLCQSSELVRKHPHRTLILCRTEDVKSAYQLCKGGRFDDYMQFWPMTFDPYRLPMSVRHSVRHLHIASAMEAAAAELAAHVQQVAAINPLLTQALDAGDKQLQRAGESAQQLSRDMAAVLSATAKTSEADRTHAAGQFRSHLQTLTEQVEGLALWSAELRRKSEPHLQSVRTMQELSANPAAGQADPARASVLVVEDEEFQQQILFRLVTKENLHCEIAGTGAAALEAINKRRPALILLDYALPDTDGVALLRRIRSDTALEAVPVIILTGNGDKQIVVSSMRAGANDFMIKPVNAERLREKLRQYVAAEASTPGSGTGVRKHP